MKKLLLFLFLSLSTYAQVTFSNCGVQSQDLDVHSALLTCNVFPDGWVRYEYGFISGGPYTGSTEINCSSSPTIQFSGGGGSGAVAYFLSLGTGGSAGYVEMEYGGTNYTSPPSVTILDSCVPHGSSPGTGMTAVATISNGSVTSVTATGGTGYHLANTTTSGQDGTNGSTSVIRIALGGIKANTQVYVVPIWMSDPNSSEGEVFGPEFTFTTLNGTDSPVSPVLPETVWNPTSITNHPSFITGYTVIPMASLSGGDCYPTETISVPYGTTTWSVTPDDSLTTILAHPSDGINSGGMFGYGAIFEFLQGTICHIPISNTFYTIPAMALDPTATGIFDPNHRYVIFRTEQINEADFPPIGFRYDPNGDNGTWQSKVAQLQSQNATGENVELPEVLRTDPGSTDCVTSVHHWWFENIAFTVTGTGNFGPAVQIGQDNDPITEMCEPKFIVFDRMPWQGPTRVGDTTTMDGGMYGSPGGYFVVSNSYFSGYDTNATETFSIIVSDCATGPSLFLNNYFGAAPGQGVYIQNDGNQYCGPLPTSPLTQLNTTTFDDISFLKNALVWDLCKLNSQTCWDGLDRVAARNQFETKGSHRLDWEGNIVNGQWCAQTAGGSIVLSAINTNQFYGSSGVVDSTINNNYFLNVAILMDANGTKGTGESGSPDNSINRHIQFNNNIAYNIGKNLFHDATTCSGLGPGYFNLLGGPQDIQIHGNTLPPISGDIGSTQLAYYPSLFDVGDGVSLTGGFDYSNNIDFISGGGVSPYGILSDNTPGCAAGGDCSNFPAIPGLNNSNNPLSLFNSAFISNSLSGVISDYTWNNNIHIGDWYAPSLTPWTQMTQSQITSLSMGFPGTSDIWVSGDTIAEREINAGYPNIENGDMNCTTTMQNPTCSTGADLQINENTIGIVRDISVIPNITSLTFNYLAPDLNPCSVDYSQDQINWFRVTNTGSSEMQTITINNLIQGTKYYYQLECYYDQSRTWFKYPSEYTNMQTDGSIVTLLPIQPVSGLSIEVQ